MTRLDDRVRAGVLRFSCVYGGQSFRVVVRKQRSQALDK